MRPVKRKTLIEVCPAKGCIKKYTEHRIQENLRVGQKAFRLETSTSHNPIPKQLKLQELRQLERIKLNGHRPLSFIREVDVVSTLFWSTFKKNS